MIDLTKVSKGDRIWVIVENPVPTVVPGSAIGPLQGEVLKYVRVWSIYGEHKVYPWEGFLDSDSAIKAAEKRKKELIANGKLKDGK